MKQKSYKCILKVDFSVLKKLISKSLSHRQPFDKTAQQNFTLTHNLWVI